MSDPENSKHIEYLVLHYKESVQEDLDARSQDAIDNFVVHCLDIFDAIEDSVAEIGSLHDDDEDVL